jgi:hypothetical protein
MMPASQFVRRISLRGLPTLPAPRGERPEPFFGGIERNHSLAADLHGFEPLLVHLGEHRCTADIVSVAKLQNCEQALAGVHRGPSLTMANEGEFARPKATALAEHSNYQVIFAETLNIAIVSMSYAALRRDVIAINSYWWVLTTLILYSYFPNSLDQRFVYYNNYLWPMRPKYTRFLKTWPFPASRRFGSGASQHVRPPARCSV